MEVTHKQFDLSGFLPDQAPDTLRSGAISSGHNLKPTLKGWEKTEGFRETEVAPTNERSHLIYWSPTQGDNRWYSCGATSVQQVEGNAVTDISRDGGYTPDGADKWNAVNFNGVLILNNEEDTPQFLAGNGLLQNLENLPSESIRFRDVSVFKSYLVALGPNFGTGFLDNEVYWSHPADPGTIPPNWDYTDPASDSGRSPLPSAGYCITAKELGGMNIIYKSDSIWTMQFIGGQFIFRFDNKFPGQGVLNKRCVTAFEGRHFVVTQNDIIVHDSYQLKSIADKKLKHYFFDSVNPEFFDRVFVVQNPRTNEITVAYPSKDSEDGFCDAALVYNWRDDNWHTIKIPFLSHSAYGYEITGGEITWDTYDTSWERGGSWQTDEDIIQYAPVLHYAFKDYPNLLTPSISNLFINEQIESVWEREDIVLGQISRDGVPYQNYDKMKTISQIDFDMDASDAFDVYLGFKENLNEDAQWEYVGTVIPSESKRLFCLFTAGFVSMRLVTKADSFTLRSMKFYYELTGEMW